jgi:RpiR family carbohydrate utilization transcriptional regulator
MDQVTTNWPTTDILARVQAAIPTLRRSERKAAALVAAAPARVAQMSLAEFAIAAAVSQPVAIRFCRSLGCDGFPGLKVQLAQAVAVGAPYVHSAIATADSASAVADKVFASSIEALHSVRVRLDMAAVERAVDALARARRIDLVGTGLSSVAALDAHHKFVRLGVATAFQPDPHLQRMLAETLEPGDVALAFSYTGLVRDVVRIVELARGRGATVIGVTRTGTALAAASDIVIPIDTQENTFVYAPMVTRLAHLAVVDVLATAVALRSGPAGAEVIRRVKRAVRDEWLIDPDGEDAS